MKANKTYLMMIVIAVGSFERKNNFFIAINIETYKT